MRQRLHNGVEDGISRQVSGSGCGADFSSIGPSATAEPRMRNAANWSPPRANNYRRRVVISLLTDIRVAISSADGSATARRVSLRSSACAECYAAAPSARGYVRRSDRRRLPTSPRSPRRSCCHATLKKSTPQRSICSTKRTRDGTRGVIRARRALTPLSTRFVRVMPPR